MESLSPRDREIFEGKNFGHLVTLDEYPWLQPGEQRVIFKIVPDQVVHAS